MTFVPFIGWAALAVLVSWVLWMSWHPEQECRREWLWWLFAATAVMCFRWPLLWTSHEFNPDEGHLIAGALTLRYDPVFWRAVEGHTAGPLVFYPLGPTAFLYGEASFAVARIIGVLATLLGLLLACRSVAILTNPLAARAAIVPAIAFEAFTTTPDFLYYSTEHAPILLLSAGIYFAVRQHTAPSTVNVLIAGLLLGAVPWGKMQAGPIAAVVWLAFAWSEYNSKRQTLALLLGSTLAPSLVVIGFAWISGEIDHFARSFALNHFAFVAANVWTLRASCVVLAQWILVDGFAALWSTGAIAFAVLVPALVIRAPERQRRLLVLAVVLGIVALGCVLLPRRPFVHYTRLLELPFYFVTALALALGLSSDGTRATRRRLFAVVTIFLLFSLAPQLGRRFSGADLNQETNRSRIYPEQQFLVETLRRYTSPGEPLAIWGWRSSLYVEAGLRQATRQGQSEQQIRANPWQHYFLNRYYEDFVASRPPVFVDAVGPGNFLFRDRAKAHDSFEPLRSWVSAHYTLVVDTGGTRVYVENERLASRRGTAKPAAQPPGS